MRDLALPVLAVIAAVLAFLWWRPVQKWDRTELAISVNLSR
jgi:hypothetical protein